MYIEAEKTFVHLKIQILDIVYTILYDYIQYLKQLTKIKKNDQKDDDDDENARRRFVPKSRRICRRTRSACLIIQKIT